MKKNFRIYFGIVLISTLGLSACGGGENKDAKAFCDCVAKLKAGNEDKQCDTDMEKLEEEFKNDAARYDAFKVAATKQCPGEQEFIDRMK